MYGPENRQICINSRKRICLKGKYVTINDNVA